jgi:hypothetical protein
MDDTKARRLRGCETEKRGFRMNNQGSMMPAQWLPYLLVRLFDCLLVSSEEELRSLVSIHPSKGE